jgi:mono/diheme cytochrome c family protein
LRLLMALLLLPGCGIRYWVCDEVDAAKLQRLPTRLSETELYTADVVAYTPAYELWSDGAAKQRWIALPAGTRVDTSDMNAWRFPQGTKLWKEFTRDGVRVETRILAKLGASDDDWVAASYVWNAEQTDAVLTTDGMMNVHNTPHDVPAAKQCAGCHGGRASRVLGFSAVQLAKQPQLEPLLTNRIEYELPGTEAQRAALGYLYANCAHCHNATRPKQAGARCYDPRRTLDLSLDVERSSLSALEDSAALADRMGRRGLGAMPPLASELVDATGLATIRAWHP